jgi:CBS domain-containing protein
VPGIGIGPGAFAVVAMAATFGAATRATFTAIVFVFELTRDYRVILPLMLATVVADIIAGVLMRDSIMTEKLARRGLRVRTDYEVDPFRTVLVRALMTTDVQTVPSDATVGDARHQFARGRHSAYPIVDDDGGCIGIVTRSDLLVDDVDDEKPVLEIASQDVVTVTPDDVAITALQRIVEEGVEHLPVVDGGILVGVCTRTDLLRVRAPQFASERHDGGAPQTQPPVEKGDGDDQDHRRWSRRHRRLASRARVDGGASH